MLNHVYLCIQPIKLLGYTLLGSFFKRNFTKVLSTLLFQEIEALPILDDLRNVWTSTTGDTEEDDIKFIAREYVKHSRWSIHEKINVRDYCYMAMLMAERFITGKDNLKELLPQLNFFRGGIYKCSNLEGKLHYVLQVKILGHYVKYNDSKIDSLDEFHVLFSDQQETMDHPDNYTRGLFLLP